MIKRIKKILFPIIDPIRESVFRMIGRINPKKIAEIRFRRAFHRRINWEEPQDFNEKIQWMKFFGDTSLWPLLADKYRVREYVSQKGLADMLVPLYGHWDSVEDINWDSLPNQFVMKPNNGCGDRLICLDKSKLDIPYWKRYMKKAMRRRISNIMGEMHYNAIKPCIIAEELLDSSKQSTPSSSLIDYKVWCFCGRPNFILVCSNRTKEKLDLSVYDLDWQWHPECSAATPHLHIAKQPIPKPVHLEQMLQAAKTLSEGHPLVRVDFYEVDGKVYFGEMTFTSAGGCQDYYSPEFLREIGNKIKLPTKE